MMSRALAPQPPVRYLTIVLLLVPLYAVTAAEPAQSPSAVVRTTFEAVLALAHSPQPASSTRRARALAVVQANFDFTAISRRVLATEWTLATPEQRRLFTNRFTELLARTYWAKLQTYQDAPVDYVDERIRNGEYATVHTVIHAASAAVPVDYRLHLTNGRWLAYDVNIEQVSLVRNYRENFRDEIRRAGVDGLIRELEAKIAAIP